MPPTGTTVSRAVFTDLIRVRPMPDFGADSVSFKPSIGIFGGRNDDETMN
jgi:hypothetical protein